MPKNSEPCTPIAYGITWENLSAPNLAEREEIGVEILNTVIKISKDLGASEVTVEDVIEAEDGSGKVVLLKAYGEIDEESLFENIEDLF